MRSTVGARTGRKKTAGEITSKDGTRVRRDEKTGVGLFI